MDYFRKMLLGLIVTSMGLGFFGIARAENKEPRYLWVWNRGNAVVNAVRNSDDRGRLFDFLANPHGTGKAIKNIFLEAKFFLGKDENKLAEFIREAARRGISVYYLDGDPTWAVAYQDEAISRVESVRNYNKNRKAEEKFAGLMFDIEPYLLIKTEIVEEGLPPEKSLAPYLLPQWKTRREEVEKKFLALLEKIKDKAGADLKLGVAVPLLYAEVESGGKSLAERVLEKADFISVMDYRDVSLRLIRDGKPFVDTAAKMGKRAIIGVETLDLVAAGEGDNASTFAEEGWRLMEGELGKLTSVFQDNPGFGGLAIHFYNTYAKLQEEDTNRPVTNVPVIHAARALKPPRLNGKLDDFKKAVPITLNKKSNVVFEAERPWGGEKDLSGNVWVMWDSGHIYMAAKIKDNKLTVTPKGKGLRMWAEDHMEVWFAPEPGVDTGIIKDYQVGLSPGNFKNIPPFIISWVPEYLPQEKMKTSRVVASKTADGYIIEAAIPTDILDNFHPRKGAMIRFSFDLSDTDDPRAKQEILISPTARVWGKSGTFAKLYFDP